MSINQNFPEVSPSLLLDFANSRTLDPRITFERASIGTYVASNGLIKTAAADEPRFDHNLTTGESLGLLIEEQRTNLFPYSGNTTITSSSNVTTSRSTGVDGNPTSALNAIYTSGSGAFILSANTVVSATNTYTFSIYMKRNSGTTTGVMYSYFNSGTAGQWSGTILNEDGQHLGQAPIGVWKRYSKTITVTSGTGVQITLPGYDSNGLNVDYFGGQIELGSFPTSYIPTSGSQFTRQPDKASITGTNFSDWYNQNEGTIYVDDKMANTAVDWGSVVGFMGQTDNNYRILVFRNYTGLTDQFELYNNGQQVAFEIPRTNTEYHKVSIALKNNDVALSFNDDYLLTDTSVTLPIVDRLEFGSTLSSSFDVRYVGHIKKLAYYPQRLTDSQLQNLTK
jgi:hypothetical protein